jgi:hypothetical protein
MATTANLNITHIEANQSQKEVTANEAFDILDEGLAGDLVHDMASDANYTLDTTQPAAEHENLMLHITDTGVVLTTTRDIILPANPQLHIAFNDTAQTLNFKTASGVAFGVTAGSVRLFYIEDTSFDAIPVADDSCGSSLAVTGLSDTPSAYAGGDALKHVRVNAGETALEFVTPATVTGVFWSLPYKGALVDLIAAITAVNASAGYTIVWDTEVRDTDAFVDLGAQATRITIPAGFPRVRLKASVQVINLAADNAVEIKIKKNGVVMAENFAQTETGLTTLSIQVMTHVLDVSATDYFEVEIETESDTNIDVSIGSWFEMEVLEVDTAASPPYDIGFFFSTTPLNAQEVFRMEALRDFTHVDPPTGATAEARVASTGDVSFSVARNGSQYATVRFNITAAGVWAFDAAADEVFVAGDTLTVIAPATADVTLADIAIFLDGVRNN